MKAALLVVLISAGLISNEAQAVCPTRGSWPTEAWPSSQIESTRTTRAAEIKALEDYAFTLVGTDGQRKGLRTDALLIIKGGELIYERYGRGFTESNRHISWSVAKSISSALTGVAVSKGVLSASDSICKHSPEARQELCPITVQHVLEFGSGIHWQETYEHVGYQYSSVIAMLLGQGHRDMPSFVLAHRKLAEPGTVFNYSTGDANLLLSLVDKAAAPTLGKDWMWPHFFDRIGMKSTVVSGDPKGNPAGGAYMFATARDFARFGYLFLNDGCWDGQRVLPEGWVKGSSTSSDSFKKGAEADDRTPNGWMWWVNDVAPNGERPWKDAPEDTYLANGHWGQFVVVVPSRDTVIVRLGDDRNQGTKLNTLIPLALSVAQ